MTEKLASPSERFSRRSKALEFAAEDAAAACALWAGGLVPQDVALMSGGFSNANFRLRMGDSVRVIRFYPDGRGAALREIAILKLALKAGVRVPTPLSDALSVEGKTFAVFEFIPGRLISDEAVNFRTIGKELGKIHGITFQRSGAIGASGTVEHVFDSFSDTALHYIVTPLGDRAGTRLDAGVKGRLLDFVKDNWSVVDETFTGATLIHCDFNPKNLIAGPSDNQITVIDWEFSIAGHPLNDLANFLRFSEDDYTPKMRAEFLAGYQEIRGPLPDRWELAARLLDLVSMCTFLNSREELPKTFHTARVIIDRTLAAGLRD